ncbi:hypothetical protein CDL15_Pgr027271 [Punica granatum]|uniref:Protein PHLOEM PROTEIN 2-LIKE A1-like n=1 Tax=Punica granatum TaxID=22663 RepID=A0A218XLA3_PUNGR|nr:hypothetical protein CDL15_Pgr027271 [Punica granatum]
MSDSADKIYMEDADGNCSMIPQLRSASREESSDQHGSGVELTDNAKARKGMAGEESSVDRMFLVSTETALEDNTKKGGGMAKPKKQRNPPPNTMSILSLADDPVDTSSREKMLRQLRAGVLLNKRKMMYKLDLDMNNIFMILPRGLAITSGSDSSAIEVAELEAVGWLDISGKFRTVDLSPNIDYKIVLDFKMESSIYGFPVPVNFNIALPDGTKRTGTVDFAAYARGSCQNLILHKFKMSPKNVGQVEFRIYEVVTGQWKGGLVIRAVSLMPIADNCIGSHRQQGERMEDQKMEKGNWSRKQKSQNNHPQSWAILTRADAVEGSSADGLHARLEEGVLLDRKTKKYMIDAASNKNMFMVLARGFAIAWGNDTRYWTWKPDKRNREEELARLKAVCWLDIAGNLQTIDLSPETEYEIVLHVKIGRRSFGFFIPINFKITLADGTQWEDSVDLSAYAKGSWHDIALHKFKTPSNNAGEVEFRIYEHSGHWKGGLVLRGVSFKPK